MRLRRQQVFLVVAYLKQTEDEMPRLEAFVKLEDILGITGPIAVRDSLVDAVIDAVVVQVGTDELVVESVRIAGDKVVINGESVSFDTLDPKMGFAIIDAFHNKAIETAISTPEKYWDYRLID